MLPWPDWYGQEGKLARKHIQKKTENYICKENKLGLTHTKADENTAQTPEDRKRTTENQGIS